MEQLLTHPFWGVEEALGPLVLAPKTGVVAARVLAQWVLAEEVARERVALTARLEWPQTAAARHKLALALQLLVLVPTTMYRSAPA